VIDSGDRKMQKHTPGESRALSLSKTINGRYTCNRQDNQQRREAFWFVFIKYRRPVD